jgi:transcriptional regulator with XRE-family HTH domain
MRKEPIATEIAKSTAMEQFRMRLAILVEMAGSQSELARRAGVSQVQISHFLSGEREPLLTTAIALAEAGGVSLEWLIGSKKARSRPKLPPKA